MTQFDFGTINPTTKSGATLATDLNSFRDAVNSGHKGSAAPSYSVAGMRWIDDSGDPLWIVRVYDGTNWIDEFAIDSSANRAYPVSAGARQSFQAVGGAVDALTLTPVPPLTSYTDYEVATFESLANNTGAATLNVSGVGAKALRKMQAGADVALEAGDILAGQRYFVVYDAAANAGAGAWILINPSIVDPWACQPLGVPIPVFDHLIAGLAPPTNRVYRYVMLTAGKTGAGGYNNGILSGETVSGSAPLVSAYATVSLASSPLNGRVVQLVNTEGRFIRASLTPGAVENDQMQRITGSMSGVFNRALFAALPGGAFTPVTSIGTAYDTAGPAQSGYQSFTFDSGNSPDARAGTETRPKNVQATYYMRIK
ncbi:hypothetical protein [Pseudaminobacter sp. NGMCC 1.201702]|uniref:hypothetical protein n=1 Tax=Pseudaminobacter sp. NGMCC 1.201702 TaxID=3391825 RepID=UPI0039EF6A60